MEKSHFSKLSAELRNRIYEIVLEDDSPIELVEADYKVVQAPATKRRLTITLSQTCHQIRDESIKMFYSSNTFTFSFAKPSPVSGTTTCLAFLNSIGATNAAAIRNITIYSEQIPKTRGMPRPSILHQQASLPKVKARYDFMLNWALGINAIAPACRIYMPNKLQLPYFLETVELKVAMERGEVDFDEVRQQASLSKVFNGMLEDEMLAEDYRAVQELITDLEVAWKEDSSAEKEPVGQ